MSKKRNKRVKWNNSMIQEYLDSNHSGYSLTSDYIDSRAKVIIECDRGHVNEVVWLQFTYRKAKCGECLQESIVKKFEEEVSNAGYRIVEYIGKRRAVLQCSLSHPPYPVDFKVFRSGTRCRECGFLSVGAQNANTWKNVKNYIEVESESGYRLIGGEYVNKNSALLTLCPRGHEHQTSIEKFKYRSARCTTCKKENRLVERNREIQEEYRKRGYHLISEYKSSQVHVLAKCPEGHEWKHLYSNFSRGADCFECKGAKKKTLEEVKSIFKNKGFEPLFDSYANNKDQLAFHCSKHPELTPQYARVSNMENGHANCRGCYLLLFTGENSSLWTGGLSELNGALRLHIYPSWTHRSLEKYNFRCAFSGATKDLHVHHVIKNFSCIVKEAGEISNVELKRVLGDYEESELLELKKEVVRLHEKYGLGVPLHKDIHFLFHQIYGRKNNTEEQFEAFKEDYYSGKFDNTLGEDIRYKKGE